VQALISQIIYLRLRFRQNEANLLLPLRIQKLKGFQRFSPDPLTRGSAPGPRWGLHPQTPVRGSCSRIRHASGYSPPPQTWHSGLAPVWQLQNVLSSTVLHSAILGRFLHSSSGTCCLWFGCNGCLWWCLLTSRCREDWHLHRSTSSFWDTLHRAGWSMWSGYQCIQ